MLGMGRREGTVGTVEVKPTVKNVLGSTPPSRPGVLPTNTQPGMPQRSPSSMPLNPPRDEAPVPPVQTRDVIPPAGTAATARTTPAATPSVAAPAPSVADTPGSKLFVGPNIKLKGVEISDCDVLVVEGQVEATVYSKGLQIAKPGTLNGTVAIDVAEIMGSFSGELTARARLVVHATGRVSGKIRYGKLIVEEGGELTGDVRQIDSSEDSPQLSLTSGLESHAGGAYNRGNQSGS
jgi:cytoskeletal protein CcmA (bactofilin family)